ncbi:MAG: hypothetical protein HY518_02105 [Candidatus Aenigmarchaeota archaeon]|nr:hypothetical protein [Candidatus Aenigmarchaeota archaeon]
MVTYILAQATGPFSLVVGNLGRMGFFSFLLPFLLMMAIVYGVLRFSLKDQLEKSASGLIAIVMSFFVLNYSGAAGIALARFLTAVFGAGLVILVGILVVIIFLGLMGVKVNDIFNIKERPQSTWAIVLLFGFIGLLLFLGAGGAELLPLPKDVAGLSGGEIGGIIFFIIVLALAVWFLGKSGGGETK